MARHQFVQPSHSISVRLCLGLYEFLASLKFAVVLITTLAVVLGLGTFVESAYGTEAVKFGVWNTWWFTLLNALLAVSIFARLQFVIRGSGIKPDLSSRISDC